MVRFPDRKLTVICLANGAASSSALAMQVADLYLPAERDSGSASSGGAPTAAAPSAAPTAALAEADWDKFLGRYKADSGPIWTVTRRGDELAVASTSGLKFTARPIGALEFESTDRPLLARLVFGMDEGGRVASITQTMANTGDVRLTLIPEMADPAAGLADFEGVYDSEELGAWMTMSVSEGRLWATGAGEPQPFPLNRDSPDGFSVWGFDAIFTRGDDGQIDGFIMNSPRASGMRFVKRPWGR